MYGEFNSIQQRNDLQKGKTSQLNHHHDHMKNAYA